MYKRVLHNLLRGIAVFIVIVAVFQLCTRLLENKSAREKYTDFFESKTNYDVIFLGTSHTYNSILPMEVWRETGISSYNWGYSNCTPAVNYYLIQEIAKYTDIKLVVLDLYGLVEYDWYGNGKYRTDQVAQQRVQFDELPFSISKWKATQDIFDDYENNLDFVINVGAYHTRWKELGERDFAFQPSPENGAELKAGIGTGAGYRPIGEDITTEIDSVCYDYFVRFLDFCHNENIEVLCVYLPYPAKEQAQKVANSVGDIIESYDAQYINMLNLGIVDYNTDLYLDNVHLNNNGATKVSRWLANYILDHYKMDNFSGDQNWIDDYKEYREFKDGLIQQNNDLLKQLSLVYGGDYSVELKISNQDAIPATDIRIAGTMQSLERNGMITYADELLYADQLCDVVIHVKDVKTNQIIHEMGYVYENDVFTPIEQKIS